MKAIAKLLNDMSVMLSLNLADNHIHADGGRYFGRALKQNYSLQHLNLRQTTHVASIVHPLRLVMCGCFRDYLLGPLLGALTSLRAVHSARAVHPYMHSSGLADTLYIDAF